MAPGRAASKRGRPLQGHLTGPPGANPDKLRRVGGRGVSITPNLGGFVGRWAA